MNLAEATKEFITTLSSPLSSNEEVNSNLQDCFNCLNQATATEIDEFMLDLFGVFGLPDVERGSLAATICGYLVEQGFSGKAILIDLIRFYESLLDKSRPFFDMFLNQVATISEDDENRDEKVNAIFQDILKDKDITSNETAYAVVALDKFYTCAVSLFSINRDNFYAAQNILKDKVAYPARYNQGCYWLDKLFSVLFDEPVVIIDIDSKAGFEGTISGIVDNYQLQHLLMASPMLNGGQPALSQEYIDIVSGYSKEYTSENVIESKWNMYSATFLDNKDEEQAVNTTTWIWSEGSPSDIPIYKGLRMILLGKPSYIRESRVQRTFRNLKANIEIDKVLTDEEIDKWLDKTD